MKLFLLRDGAKRTRLVTPHDEAHATVPDEVCPRCAQPLLVHGTGRRASEDDQAWEADAFAVCCGAPIGLLRLEMNTLFGVREDEAVLRGRARVYLGGGQ